MIYQSYLDISVNVRNLLFTLVFESFQGVIFDCCFELANDLVFIHISYYKFNELNHNHQ